MEDKTNSNNIVIVFFLSIFVAIFISAFGFLGMLLAFGFITPYIDNFVLKPLSKKLSAKHNTPSNYMYRKLKNVREVAWVIFAIFNFPLIFVIEAIAMTISVNKINELKRELGIPVTSFSKDDYLIYEEYSKYSEDDEYNKYEDFDDSQEMEVNTIKEYSTDKTYSIDNNEKYKEIQTVIKFDNLEDKEEKLKNEIEAIKNELYEAISDEPVLKKVQKFDFDKPVGDIEKVEPLKTNTSSIWDAPLSRDEEKTTPSDDEICCEKCGTVMSKMKIACPKCGTLVKNSYRTGK